MAAPYFDLADPAFDVTSPEVHQAREDTGDLLDELHDLRVRIGPRY